MELKDAVAIVTGGNGGLGSRICYALAQQGTHIAVVYAQKRGCRAFLPLRELR
ncbi:MAG: SDR family NAD(P)-dependent oxidoreductase [Nitrospinae bacterium]|nr:SDR family NAD(P)-dependent oxidoreductase [Nitrospinota bacterium]